MSRIRVVLVAGLATASFMTVGASGASAVFPSKVTALGDSITTGFQDCSAFPWTDCPENSWATGTKNVQSVFYQISLHNREATATNRAVTGAKVASLNNEAKQAASDEAEFVTIMIGANDACANPPTSQASFRSAFQESINILKSRLPAVRIYVASIPNLQYLWGLFHNNPAATSTWETYNFECPGIMTEPTSEGAAAKARRAATGLAERGYNAIIKIICAAAANCQYDNGLVFAAKFAESEVSTVDFYHPSVSGQTSLAAAAWRQLESTF